MAVVFLGRDAHLGRKVAIKLLPPELTLLSASALARFKREARLAATLDHPNIIPIYSVSSSGRLFWYVMRFVEGESLDHVLKREGQLALDQTCEIVRQVASGLGYAHRKGVIHRDVKPANVMIDDEGRVTVMDFGIAKALNADSLTGSGSMIGTPFYMSPEQCSGRKIGPASDQYALAVMTYQMLGGHLPFTGDSVADIVHKHVMAPVPPLLVLRPNLPEGVAAVVERGLAKTPEQRFASVGEFAQALGPAGQRVPEKVSPVAAPAGTRASETTPVGPAVVMPPHGEISHHRSRMPRALSVLLGATVVVGIGVAAWLQSRPRPKVPALTRLDTAVMSTSVSDSLRGTSSRRSDSTTVPESMSVSPVATAPVPASASRMSPARLTLRGVPSGAVMGVDGRRTEDTVMTLEPGRRHMATVIARGYEPWLFGVTLRAGERRDVAVTLRPAQTVASPAVLRPSEQPAQAAGGVTEPSATSPPAAERPRPSTSPAAETATGSLSVGTRPISSIIVNGRPAPTNPLTNYPVPTGRVLLRFQVTDSTGVWWGQDVIATIEPGRLTNLRWITLTRQP